MEELQTNFVKLSRKILEWEWYSDINTKVLFIHCLIKANWKDGKFKGIDVPRGSFVSSFRNLADETGLSVKQVRVALEHLEMTHEMAHWSTAKFTVFTVNNYSLYQDNGTLDGNQTANKGQTKGNNRRNKEVKKERNSNIRSFQNFSQNEYDFDSLEKMIQDNGGD